MYQKTEQFEKSKNSKIVQVGIKSIINNINLPIVIKTAKVPGDDYESLFVATQIGEILKINLNELN